MDNLCKILYDKLQETYKKKAEEEKIMPLINRALCGLKGRT
jgi:hypothetical protein